MRRDAALSDIPESAEVLGQAENVVLVFDDGKRLRYGNVTLTC
jgi:hypothetical protein